MASPQWKPNYQPAAADPAILAFQRTPAPATVAGGVSLPAPSTHVSHNIRETGIIEKILRSYGFIQCAEREARLFFHFSEYSADVDDMKIGDPVEFQMSFDRKTGKPIAIAVVPLEAGSVSFEVLGDEKLKGTVIQAANANKNKNANSTAPDGWGRVSYEQKGECFFIPFGSEDVDGDISLDTGDEVYFYIATDKRNGNLRAKQIALVHPKELKQYQGVICSMKNQFGFIERADVVKEIFFHYSEYDGNIDDLELGGDVSFKVTYRNGKEVATEISKLPAGTVIFEDVALEKRRGKIQKPLPHSRRQSEPLSGRIVYETVNGPIEIPFGDKDQKAEHTLNPGDMVEFNIATDRRDDLQRATNIVLVEDTFKFNGESREKGIIQSLKDGFGFIDCVEREGRIFFHFSEIIDIDWDPRCQDEVEFTVVPDPSGRSVAIRIRQLAKGSVSFETVHPQKYQGTVEKEPTGGKSAMKGKDSSPGIIMYDVDGVKQTIPFSAKAVQGQFPKFGDKIEFQICESKKNNTKTAVNVLLAGQQQSVLAAARSVSGARQQGFIATLKENFGFIETAEHDKEVFFHFSAFDGDPSELTLGDEVEFSLSRKVGKVSAEGLRKLQKGSVAPEDVAPEVIDGKILRCMRIVNPEQEDYPGIVEVDNSGENPLTYTYGITSLADKHDFLQQGDVVKFQIATVRATGHKRATRIAAVRKYIRANVDSVKGQFGFLNYVVPEEGKKLFFHMTEVHDGIELHTGDEVEFVVVRNQRNGKYSACSLRKISNMQRPERLISRLKSVNDDNLPKMIVIRQPLGPDGSKGFQKPRVPWTPAEA